MKYIIDFIIKENHKISCGYCEMVVKPSNPGVELPDALPGQFVQIKIPHSPSTFLRRPISICDIDKKNGTMRFLIRNAGEGTDYLINMTPGEHLNIITPLGHGFNQSGITNALLVGGGVGIAPMHMLGKVLAQNGVKVDYLVGARTSDMLLLTDKLALTGEVHITTDDGSEGIKGVVTDHPVFSEKTFERIYCCGPAPMMKAVARKAKELCVDCEVSLENMMACGVGACLCCVENTTRGNVCVCTEGPVFNIKELKW